jgi:nucleoside-diphosphate-sugar epimerase
VYDYQENAVVTESASLEQFPERRGSYSATKQEAETYVSSFAKSGGVPTVILRPGTIYGPGGELYTPLFGFAIGSRYVVLGSGGFRLPYVYVENLVDAIVQCSEKDEAVGEIFNVVDPEKLTKREYMNRVIRRVNASARVLYLPLAAFYGIVWLQEVAFGLMKRRPVLTRYRVVSSQKNVTYDSSRIAQRLGWRPGVPVSEALDRLVASEQSRDSKGTSAVTHEKPSTYPTGADTSAIVAQPPPAR